MSAVYLRREPRARTNRAVVRRAIAAGCVLLVFAIVDTTASVEVTRLTRGIADTNDRITALESRLGYLVQLETTTGADEPRGRATMPSGFVTPDSGHVVVVALPTELAKEPLHGARP